MAVIALNPFELQEVSKELESISTRMVDCFKKMNGSVNQLRGAWTDENGKGFAERWDNEVESILHKFSDAVMKYSDFISEANRIYREEYSDTTHSAIHGNVNMSQ